MRRPRLWVLALLVGASSIARAADAPSPQSARSALLRVETELGNLENGLVVVRAEVAHQVAEVRYFPVERRLLDADLFFETKDYEKAATLYRDLAENPNFVGKPGYLKAVYKLAESLFFQRNYIGARRYYKVVATPAAGPEYGLAVARLFEVAVLTHDFRDVEVFESLVLSGSLSTPETLYAYGKYLYAAGRRTQAAEILARVPSGSGPFARAMYFLGVAEAAAGRFDSAMSMFLIASKQPVKDDADRDVQGYAALARARVLYAMGKPRESLEVLKEVDPKSAARQDSLFDAAWAYFKLDDLRSAAEALELLLITATPGELTLRASALRGRILVRLGEQRGATDTYKEVSDSLGPVASELDRMAADPRILTAYFEWVMQKGSEDVKVEAPVTERTSKWLESDPDMAGIVGMLQDLLRQREDLRESFEILERLLWALRSGGKMEAFPALKDRYLKLKEVEGRFLNVALEAANTGHAALAAGLSGPAAQRYADAVKARQAAATRFRDAPRSVDDYKARERKLGTEYQELGRQVFLVESLLRMQRQQVLAIDEWLREQRASETGTPLSQDREAGIRAELDARRQALNAMHQEALRLKDRLEREMALVNSPERLRGEDEARRELMRALAEEAKALREAAPTDAGVKDLAAATAGLIQRGVDGAASVVPLVAGLMDVVNRGAAEYEAAVLQEKARVEAESGAVSKAEMDSRAFAEVEGARVFRGVRDRLGQVLLEADLGLVDMAWQREQVLSDRMRELGQERAARMKDVNRLEKLLKAEQDAGSPEKGKPAEKEP